MTCSARPGKHYYFAKIIQADGSMLWSAPVWATVAELAGVVVMTLMLS